MLKQDEEGNLLALHVQDLNEDAIKAKEEALVLSQGYNQVVEELR